VSPQDGARRFATILFTDIVGSTAIASELGDRRWRALVRAHHSIVRRELRRTGGREMDTAGDGFFAIFDAPGAAIRCAASICAGVREVGLEVRAGVHGGEVETDAGKAGGIAVNTAARVMAVAGAGEVLVSSSLRDVVAGSSLAFDDHGVHRLKGIEGEWRLFRLTAVDGSPVEGPLDVGEASRRRLAIDPAPGGRRGTGRRRSAALGLGAAAALVVVAGVVIALASRGGAPPQPERRPAAAAGPPANALAEVDTRTGEVTLVRSDVPASSLAQFANDDLAVGEGSVWLSRPPNIYRIDPSDGSHTPVQVPSAKYTQDLDVGLDATWLLGPWVFRVDPATGIAGDAMRLPRPENRQVFYAGIAVGSRDLWIATRGPYVIRFDVDAGRGELIRLRGADESATPETIAADERTVWLLDEFSGIVWRVDQRTGRTLEPIHLSGALDRLAVGEGFAWVLDTALGTLTPVDATTGEPRSAIPVGADASDVAVGLGSVWVASGGDVLEIDPGTMQVVDTLRIGPTPIARLAVDEATAALWLDMAPSG
jgi:class 3 adenylate cyclase